MLSLENALKVLMVNKENLGVEKILLSNSLNKILAEDIVAPIAYPSYNSAPINGYALKSLDTVDATFYKPSKLKVVCELLSGKSYNNKIYRGECIKVLKGAVMPDGADCIINENDTNKGNNILEVYRSYKSFENYSYSGEYIKSGKILFKAGETLTPINIMKLAKVGVNEITVLSDPIVGIIPVGNELKPLNTQLKEGQIYNSNSYYLNARINELGGRSILYEIIDDNEESVRNKILKAKKHCDIIVSTGGVSSDKDDKVKQGATLAGFRLLFWRVDIDLGTNIFAGKRDNKLFFGLPGTPTEAIGAFESLVAPLILKMKRENSY